MENETQANEKYTFMDLSLFFLCKRTFIKYEEWNLFKDGNKLFYKVFGLLNVIARCL